MSAFFALKIFFQSIFIFLCAINLPKFCKFHISIGTDCSFGVREQMNSISKPEEILVLFDKFISLYTQNKFFLNVIHF